MIIYNGCEKFMKLLCTADLHLKSNEPERLEVLDWLYRQAAEQEADALLIAGDLFDSNQDCRELQGKVIQQLVNAESSFPVIIVPGNHDEYLTQVNGLPSTILVLTEPGEWIDVDDGSSVVRIFGLPYSRGEMGATFLESLDLCDRSRNLLLTHGTLITPEQEYLESFDKEDQGDNSFLYFSEDFIDLDLPLAVLGHWHHGGRVELGDTNVLMPGSPVPNSKSERGSHQFYIIDWEGYEPEISSKSINTAAGWFNLHKELFVVPGYEESSYGEFQKLLENQAADCQNCHLFASVTGFTSQPRVELKRGLQELADEYRQYFKAIDLDSSSLIHTDSLDEPLVQRYIEKIQNLDWDERNVAEFFQESESDFYPWAKRYWQENRDELCRRILQGALKSFSNRLSNS